jgi:DNA invertase Pin-like site-specific DNA recombinase
MNPMRKSWQPTPQECALLADMLAARRPKSAIARFLYISESTLRRFLARAGARGRDALIKDRD